MSEKESPIQSDVMRIPDNTIIVREVIVPKEENPQGEISKVLYLRGHIVCNGYCFPQSGSLQIGQVDGFMELIRDTSTQPTETVSLLGKGALRAEPGESSSPSKT